MPGKPLVFKSVTSPHIVGTGLVALDVVLNEASESSPRLWAGGTCGNVLSILAYLGWNATPVSRLGRDAASRLIIRDFRRWGVNVEFASVGPTTPGPIIIHRIRKNSAGEPFHSFSLNCPDCGRHLPSYRPVPESSLEAALSEIPRARVFFADRVSRGVLTLARFLRDRGALVVYEPSGISDPAHFAEMLSLTHVLKYSQERLPDLETSIEVPLIVETLGRGGLRYRSHLNRAKTRGWQRCEPFKLNRHVDTAGAGDWCTAGIIHNLGRHGSSAFKQIGPSKLQAAFDFGQALAAWNCGFLGARGGMYATSKSEFEATIQDIIQERGHSMPEPDEPTPTAAKVVARVCSECRGSKKPALGRSFMRLLHG